MFRSPPPPLQPAPRPILQPAQVLRPDCDSSQLGSVETTLISRARAELSQQFHFARPILIGSAPGCFDVMGGIAADDTGAIACQMPSDRSAAVMLQAREADRDLQLFSFNLYDDHLPFTFRMPLARLAGGNAEQLKREFAEPGRGWAAHVAGCLFVLHEKGLIDLGAPSLSGLNIALHNTIPRNAGLGSSNATQVATMRNLVELFGLHNRVDAITIAELCQIVSQRIAGISRGIREPMLACCGKAGEMMRVRCQPCELLPPLLLPDGFQIVPLSSGARSNDAEHRARRTRIAAAMGHTMILVKMREMGRASGHELVSDPMNGYLANLDQEDYKKFFRSLLPQKMSGSEFLSRFGDYDSGTGVSPVSHLEYNVLGAVDHHVLEARRIKQFCDFIEQSRALPLEDKNRFILMDKAGHLMYASHLSYTNDAELGDDACDRLVQLVRGREKAGLYGARMTGMGCGGTVAVLAERTDRANEAIREVQQSDGDRLL